MCYSSDPKITVQEICNKTFAYSYSGIRTLTKYLSFGVQVQMQGYKTM